MSTSALIAAFWVLAATGVAFLPMRRQYVPGVALLALAPVLIGWLWWDHSWVAGLAALAGFLSMFRNPLRYFWRKWRGDGTLPERDSRSNTAPGGDAEGKRS
jgi:hypothetical protein